MFISTYENSTRTCGFTDEENLMRLQRCLKGKAFEAVSCRLMLPSSVTDVIRTLKLLFGRPELIIHNLLAKIRTEQSPKTDNLQSIIDFALSVQNLCAVMESSGLTQHINNPMLLQELVCKLPAQISMNWGMYTLSTPMANLSHFSSWLYQMAEAASMVSVGTTSTFSEPSSNKSTKAKGHVNAHTAQTVEDDPEILKEMEKLNRKERWARIKKDGLCRICFGKHHSSRCKETKLCGKDGCEFKHHRLLHNDDTYNRTKNSVQNSQKVEESSSRRCNTHQQSVVSRTLFRIVPVILYGKTKKVETFAFLDEGSSLSMIDESVARELELDGTPEKLCLKWTADTTREETNSRRVSVEISGQSTDEGRKYRLHDVRTVSQLNLPIQTIGTAELVAKYPHLRNVPFANYEQAVPQILIGIDNWKLCTPTDVREGKWQEPVATKTRIGWTVYGQYHHHSQNESAVDENVIGEVIVHNHYHICDCSHDEKLHKIVKDFFSLENFGVRESENTIESVEEKRARAIMDATTKIIGNRYETGLLWRYDEVDLPDSFLMAKQRFECLEKKMLKNPDLRKNLDSQMNEYVEKGYARKLSVTERSQTNKRTWYLPIFAVINPNKPGKIRMVWDAAAKTNGISLNSVLLKGPDQLTSLPNILYGFRQKQVAIAGDIKQMFHQVRIRLSDQNSQRFLWRFENGQLDVYVMQVMTFGASCSPSSAHFVKNLNALRFSEKHARAVDAIINHHYVDDLLDSVDTKEEAIKLAREIRFIHEQGGFEIRNWLSNSKEVQDTMNPEKSSVRLDFAHDFESGIEKVLGMWWCITSDAFTYSIRFNKLNKEVLFGKRRPTKREVLRTLMSVFDPLGFLAAFLVYVKMLLQEIWRSSIGWDDKIEDSHFEKWLIWIGELPKIEKIKIPRCYFVTTSKDFIIDLHMFVDASENAYAAVGYFRCQCSGTVQCSLIGAKTKVAPQRPISIPRLELQAAVLGSRLASAIIDGHTVPVRKRVFWTDSKTVLCWLRGDPKRFRQFVALRIGEILESTKLDEWRWIPTKENVADDATKWQSVPDVGPKSRWFNGPEFLLMPEISWPMDNISATETVVQEELRTNLVHVAHVESFAGIDINRFENWWRMLHAQMMVNRVVDTFKFIIKKLNDKPIGPYRSPEFCRAENILIRRAQFDEFGKDIQVLLKNVCVPVDDQVVINRSSVLFKLSPYLDENGLLRIYGRIDAAACTGDMKRPIILPRKHRITQLIVKSYHKRYHHQNHETTINEIRQRFYVPKLRQVLKDVRLNCQWCKNALTRPNPPQMAELPAARLASHTRPFTFVGVDYFGPMFVTVGRSSVKRWGVLFTCLTIRAVHIEIAQSLNTDSCIMCIRNFMARRGTPQEIYSDNGTNFHGSNNELERALKEVKFDQLQQKFECQTTKWIFIPPASPHMGGSWERLVGSIKKILTVTMPIRNPTDEVLRSFLIEAENIVNSRPLTHVSVEPSDSEALTPNHFLLGSSNGLKPPGEFTDADQISRKNWRKSQNLADFFWKRWLREYLPTLTRRGKWFNRVSPIKVDDIVVVADQDLPRNCWPKGRVVSTNLGKDGQVRSAVIQTKSGILTRPAVKIAVLDVAGLPINPIDKPGAVSPTPKDKIGELN